jgi:hypothetical protein
MSQIQVLEVTCDKCKVSEFCPKSGSSPLMTPDKQIFKCKLIGGYGRVPLDMRILSEQSKKLVEKNGPCLTIAEIPEYDEPSGEVFYKVTKIFNPPILHEREKIGWNMRMIYPETFDPTK